MGAMNESDDARDQHQRYEDVDVAEAEAAAEARTFVNGAFPFSVRTSRAHTIWSVKLQIVRGLLDTVADTINAHVRSVVDDAQKQRL